MGSSSAKALFFGTQGTAARTGEEGATMAAKAKRKKA